jgi:thiosulfate reductase cytochrome b subunit
VTALSLEGTPSSARALHVMALVFGLISTITTCWNQNTLGSFNQKETLEEKIRTWMTVGREGRREVSVFAAMQLAFPGLLLFLAAVFLVAGLGVHVSEVWRGGTLWTFGVALVFGVGGYGSVGLGKLACG